MAVVRAGVYHEDMRWRHVLCKGDQIRIIDFGEAFEFRHSGLTWEQWEAKGQAHVDELFEHIDEEV